MNGLQRTITNSCPATGLPAIGRTYFSKYQGSTQGGVGPVPIMGVPLANPEQAASEPSTGGAAENGASAKCRAAGGAEPIRFDYEKVIYNFDNHLEYRDPDDEVVKEVQKAKETSFENFKRTQGYSKYLKEVEQGKEAQKQDKRSIQEPVDSTGVAVRSVFEGEEKNIDDKSEPDKQPADKENGWEEGHAGWVGREYDTSAHMEDTQKADNLQVAANRRSTKKRKLEDGRKAAKK